MTYLCRASAQCVLRVVLVGAPLAACTASASQEKQEPAAVENAPKPVAMKERVRMKIGDVIPSASVGMKNVDGAEVTLEGAKKDKGLLVIFTCNHCPYAKAWEERIAKIGKSAFEQGFGVVAINPNDPAKYEEDDFAHMVKKSKQLELAFPYVVDATSDVARSFGATKTPEVFLFGAEGKLVYHGAVDDEPYKPESVESHYLEDALQQMIGGKPVSQAETRSVGCSIKFRPQA